MGNSADTNCTLFVCPDRDTLRNEVWTLFLAAETDAAKLSALKLLLTSDTGTGGDPESLFRSVREVLREGMGKAEDAS